MRLLIMFFFTISSVSAHTIIGTPVLKGSVKSKVIVNTVTTDCRVKVEKVRNSFEEDSFGNPSYLVRAEVSLDGNDVKKKIRIKHSQKFEFSNLFTEGSKLLVKDSQYFSPEGATLQIDSEGRLENVKITFEGKTVTCLF